MLLVPQDDKARALAEEINEPLTAQKLVVKMAGPSSPGVACLANKATRNECLHGIQDKAKSDAVFVVSGAMKGARGSLTIEMLVDGKVVKKQTTAVAKGRVKQQTKGMLAQLIKLIPKGEAAAPVEAPKVTVTQKEPEPEPEPVKPPEPEPVKPVADAPKVTPRLTPEPKRDDDLELRTPAPIAKKPKVGAWIFTGLAVAAAGTAGTFGGLGMAGKSQLENAPNGVSPLTYPEATALQQTTNTQFTVALGSGIGAGVAAVVAAILWGVE